MEIPVVRKSSSWGFYPILAIPGDAKGRVVFGVGAEQHVAVNDLAHQTLVHTPGSAETQGKGNEQIESAEVDVEVSVLWQTTHHLCERIKNHQKANPVFPRLSEAETALKTMRHLKSLMCPFYLPRNSLGRQLLGWGAVFTPMMSC